MKAANLSTLRLAYVLRTSYKPFSTRAIHETSKPVSSNSKAETPRGTLIFFGVPIAVTFSLGVWQVHRLRRKIHLVESREKALAQPPLPSSQLQNPGNEYHVTELKGRFLHNKEMLVGPRSAPKEIPTAVLQWGGSSGLQVITPFELDGGDVVLVNRGWIPQRLAERRKRENAAVNPHPFLMGISDATRMEVYDDGEAMSRMTCVTGVIRRGDEKNRFTPTNDPSKDAWYYVDTPQMLHHANLPGNDDAVVELINPLPKTGWPYPRSLSSFAEFRTPPSTHTTYAVTWFALSASIAFLSRMRLKGRL